MGYDRSEESNKQILFWAVLSLVSLAALVPLFNWYFNSMTDDELDTKVAVLDRDDNGIADYLEERNTQLREARRQIESAPVSIAAAIDQLASSGRAIPVVAPRRNDGLDTPIGDAVASLAAVEGWGQNKDEQGMSEAQVALLTRRSVAVGQRLGVVSQTAVELKLDDLAAEASQHRQSVRSTPDLETLTAAEEWLGEWPRRRALAETPQ